MDNSVVDNQPPTQSSQGARCEKHGLLYNPADARGCVLCRRETGKPVVAASAVAADDGGALRRAWLVAAGLLLGTTLVLYLAHDQAIQAVLSWTGPAMEGAREDPGFELDEEGNPVDPYAEKIREAFEALEEVEARSEEQMNETDDFLNR